LQKILVTGGAGFIGSNLIEKLVELYPKSEIISIDNYFTGSKKNHINSQNVSYIEEYTCNIDNILAIWSRGWSREKWVPDTIFHLGEFSRIVQSFKDIEICGNSNMRGTFAVLNYWRRNKCKLIYAASSSKFGNDGKDENLSPYAWMKAKNVELIKNFSDWFGLDYAITYFFNVYGPRQILEGEYAAVIGIFQNQYLAGKPLTVVEPGTQRRDFTYVEDIVEGMIKAAEKGSGDGYLLGTGVNHQIIDVAKMFNHEIKMIPERKGERFSGKAYPSKAEKELGWKAKTQLKDYINNWIKNLS